MEIFAVSFLVFAVVSGLLVLGQRIGGRTLPVGCRPESGSCCRAGAEPGRVPRTFGNSIESGGVGHGKVETWCPESG